jgi:hypothetical protein
MLVHHKPSIKFFYAVLQSTVQNYILRADVPVITTTEHITSNAGSPAG